MAVNSNVIAFGLPRGNEPLFWAEAGDNSLTGQVQYGPPLFNADDQVLAVQTTATGAAWY